MVIHHDVAEAVDALLRGWSLTTEVRTLGENGQINMRLEESEPEISSGMQESAPTRNRRRRGREQERTPRPGKHENGHRAPRVDELAAAEPELSAGPAAGTEATPRKMLRVYPYGVGQNRLRSPPDAGSLSILHEICDDCNLI